MAIAFTDGGSTVTFDSIWEYVLWVLVLPFVVGAVMGCLFTLMYVPDPAALLDMYIHAAVATGRLIKSLLVLPTALSWA